MDESFGRFWPPAVKYTAAAITAECVKKKMRKVGIRKPHREIRRDESLRGATEGQK